MNSNEWVTIAATDYCVKVADGTHDSPKRTETGKPLITSKHIKGKSIDFESAYLISYDDFKKINLRSKVDQWDVLISMIGEYCGYCYVEQNEAIDYSVKNVGIFKTGKKTKALWLYYYLSSPVGKEILNSLRSGTSQPYISLGALRALNISVPKEERKMERIVSILACLDDKIELNRQINQTLEAIAQALFKEWFVDFKFPGATGEMQDSELGVIPKGWMIGKLRDFVELSPKLSLKKGRLYKYVEMKDLSENSSRVKKFIEREFSSGSKFQNGDTLFARITPCLENGKTGFVDFLSPNEIAWGSTEFIVLRGKEISSYYVYCLARSNKFRDFAIQAMVGSSGRQRVVESILEDYDVIVPPTSLFKLFDKSLTSLFSAIKTNNDQIQTLTQLRDALLPELMKGEIIV